MALKDYSTSASLNVTLSGITTAPGMARADVDNAIRQLMADSATDWSRRPVNVKDYGAIGDGVTNDTSAINTAIATGRAVFFPKGAYQYTASGQALAAGQVLYGENPITTTINKVSNGDMFTMAAGSGFHHIGLLGNGGTYTGRGLVFGASTANCTLLDFNITGMAGYGIEFTADGAGSQLTALGGIWDRQDVAQPAVKLATDTAATPRTFTDVKSTGVLMDFGGCDNTLMNGCYSRNYVWNDTCKKVVISGGRISSLGSDINVKGTNCVISGAANAGAIILNANATACVISGTQPGFAVTDSSGMTGTNSNHITAPPATYTSVVTQGAGTFAIGNGSIAASYTINGRDVSVSILITVGSTTTFGTGVIFATLPYAMDTVKSLLTVEIFDTSAAALRMGYARLSSGSQVELHLYDGSVITQAAPFTLATGDTITISGTYRK